MIKASDVLELLVMLLTIFAILAGNIYVQIVALFLEIILGVIYNIVYRKELENDWL